MTWLRLTQACMRAGRPQNVLYRLASLGRVRTRRAGDGRLEFHSGDLDALRHADPTPRAVHGAAEPVGKADG